VTAGCKFNWFTAGPPAKSPTAKAAVNATLAAHALAANRTPVNLLKMLFIMFSFSLPQISQI
jgi:hypothetical protein